MIECFKSKPYILHLLIDSLTAQDDRRVQTKDEDMMSLRLPQIRLCLLNGVATLTWFQGLGCCSQAGNKNDALQYPYS